jgi:hypothetical protein
MFEPYQDKIWFSIIRWIVSFIVFFVAYYITRFLLGQVAEILLRAPRVDLLDMSEFGVVIIAGIIVVVFLKYGYNFVLRLCPRPQVIAWIFTIFCLFIIGTLSFNITGMDRIDLVATMLSNLIPAISLGWIIYERW